MWLQLRTNFFRREKKPGLKNLSSIINRSSGKEKKRLLGWWALQWSMKLRLRYSSLFRTS